MPDPFLTELPKIVSIFALAFFSFWSAIPAGLALGLPPLIVIGTTAASYAAGVGVVTLAGGRLRTWIMRRIGNRAALDPESRLGRIWRRWGMIGLGMIAPFTVGAQIGAAIGLALDAPPRRLFAIMAGCGLAWSIALTAAVALGAAGVQSAL
ncbi:MAG: small multi-drug export protein [bacterium]|nr:small multi-drug export protein [bacterium]